MRSSDFSPSIPPRFVAFAWRYYPCARLFAPRSARRSGSRPGHVFPGCPCRCLRVETSRSPRFLGNPHTHAHPWTPVRPSPLATRSVGAAFHQEDGVGSHDELYFGIELQGPTHSLCTLRSPRSPLVHATLGTGWSLAFAGQGYLLLDSIERFQLRPSPFPKLFLAQPPSWPLHPCRGAGHHRQPRAPTAALRRRPQPQGPTRRAGPPGRGSGHNATLGSYQLPAEPRG